jgi:thioredoxin reductase (NADPH)
MSARSLVIVGAGPAGLAAAIAAKDAGLDYVVLEKGVLVNSIYNFPPQMTFFTTPELLEIGGLPFVSPYEKPTRAEALRYYRRVVATHGLNLLLDREVTAIVRDDTGFELRTRTARGEPGLERASAVIVASGYYDRPNRLGIPGEDLPHVSHYYGDPHALYRHSVVIVGGKNSAAIAALEAYRAGATSVTLVHRGQALSDSIKYWIRPDIENRIREGSIGARLGSQIVEIRERSVIVASPAERVELPADVVLLLTGYRPDVELLRGAGVRIDDSTLKPAHDAETLETNVPGLYVVGSASAGRETNRIFIETGRFHGEAAVRALCRHLQNDPA